MAGDGYDSCMKDTIEKGLDVTAAGGPHNAYTSVNVLGVPNVVDSIYAMKKVIFEEKKYTMKELNAAIADNWKGAEVMLPDYAESGKIRQ